jgi:hypothetical protein
MCACVLIDSDVGQRVVPAGLGCRAARTYQPRLRMLAAAACRRLPRPAYPEIACLHSVGRPGSTLAAGPAALRAGRLPTWPEAAAGMSGAATGHGAVDPYRCGALAVWPETSVSNSRVPFSAAGGPLSFSGGEPAVP